MKNRRIPAFLDPALGSFHKRFNSHEEMARWKQKAKKLEGGDIFYYDLWKQK